MVLPWVFDGFGRTVCWDSITYAVVLLCVIGCVVDCLREYLQLMASVAFRTPTYLSVQYQISF